MNGIAKIIKFCVDEKNLLPILIMLKMELVLNVTQAMSTIIYYDFTGRLIATPIDRQRWYYIL